MTQCSFHAKFLIVNRHCNSSVTACRLRHADAAVSDAACAARAGP